MNAWGASWGGAWGDSWGASDETSEQPGEEAEGGYLFAPPATRQRRKNRNNEAVLLHIIQGGTP